jgi:serine/threonine-protein kinase
MFVLIAGLVTFFTLRLARERDRALAETERTRRIQQFMLDLFGEEDQTAAPSKDLTVLAAADRWAAGLATLKSDPETETELYETLGRVYEQLHQMPKAEKFLQAGVEKARTLAPGNPRAVDAIVQLGLLRGDQAQFPEAERLMREAVDLARRMHLPADNPRFMNAQLSLGRVLVQAGAYEKGVSILQPIVNRPPNGEEETINLLESLTALGVANHYLGHYDRAEAANRRALELDRKLHGDSHPRVATDLANIATTEMTLGHYPQAEDLYGQAAAILERRYGPENVVALQIRSFIAVAEMRSGNHVEAQKLLHDLVPIEEKAYGTSVHPTVAFAHQTLGNLAESRHNLAEAESEYRQALEINQKLYGSDQYLTAITAASLAGAVLQEGRYAEAEAIARPAVKTLTARPMPGNISVGTAQHNLGEAILKQKRYQEAAGPLAAAYEYLKNLPSVPKDRLERVRADLLEAYDALKRPDLAAAIRSGQTAATSR